MAHLSGDKPHAIDVGTGANRTSADTRHLSGWRSPTSRPPPQPRRNFQGNFGYTPNATDIVTHKTGVDKLNFAGRRPPTPAPSLQVRSKFPGKFLARTGARVVAAERHSPSPRRERLRKFFSLSRVACAAAAMTLCCGFSLSFYCCCFFLQRLPVATSSA
ncbi:unnamed protein product, partial [Laminaria digitata]